MNDTEANNLLPGTLIHCERPGSCRALTISAHRAKGGLYVQGGPVRAYWGDTLKLLHLPEDCPYTSP